MTSEREQLLAHIEALEQEQQQYHRANGYQLSKSDVSSLDELIQRALQAGNPDALKQFMAIRVAHAVHGKVSYEQLKLLKEVSDVFSNYKL